MQKGGNRAVLGIVPGYKLVGTDRAYAGIRKEPEQGGLPGARAASHDHALRFAGKAKQAFFHVGRRRQKKLHFPAACRMCKGKVKGMQHDPWCHVLCLLKLSFGIGGIPKQGVS